MNKGYKLDYCKYRFDKALSTFEEVEVLIQNKYWNTSINRLYYSCFYAVPAILILHDVELFSHAGVRQMFGLHFIKTGVIQKKYGNLFSELFDKRLKGDYDDFIDTDDESVNRIKPLVEDFLQEVKSLINSSL